MNGELVIVPGSLRCYSVALDGTPDPDAPIVAPDEQVDRQRQADEAEKQRLLAIVERGREAEERLEVEVTRRLREWRQGAVQSSPADVENDPGWAEADERAYSAMRAMRGRP